MPIEKGQEHLRTEVAQYEELGEHPNLIRLIHYNLNGNQRFGAPLFERIRPYLVLEEISGGSLFEHVAKF